jgi:hypothetical protein
MSNLTKQGRTGSARGVKALVALATAAVTLAGPMAGSSTAAASAGTGLRSLRCTRLSSDAAIEAPLYAQQEGASGGTDQWWCQLPHATEVPSTYVELRHLVAPISYPYAYYSTYYGPSSNATTPTGLSGPGLVVAVDWNSTVRRPRHLTYPAPPKGQEVRLTTRVTGTLVVSKKSVSVTWRYPSSGVPKYLQGVVAITVSGTGLSEAVVLGVARHVVPD